MKLGFVSAIFPDWSLDQVLEFAGAEKFDCVEIMCWPPGRADRKFAGVTHLDVCALDDGAVRRVHELCERHGVFISGLGYYPNPLSNDAEEAHTARDHLKRVIEGAARLGLSNVNTFIGNNHTQPHEENFQAFTQVWPHLIQFAEQHGVRIGIENCPMLFTRDEWPSGKNMARNQRIWRAMFDAIPSQHFGLNYDPSHFVMQMMDPIAPIYNFAERLFHIHAKDMRIDRQKLDEQGILALNPQWSTPKIPGLGDVCWNKFFSALTDVGYSGSVCVEVEDHAFYKSEEGRKQSLRISRNVLRPLIG